MDADKFQVGDSVICAFPAVNSAPGFLGRRGIVVSQREMWRTTENGICLCYGVIFEGARKVMAATEEELQELSTVTGSEAGEPACR
jgi:hypothetical protein